MAPLHPPEPYSEEDGVFGLLTQLCNKTAYNYSLPNKVSKKKLISKMRALSYEFLLKKSSVEISKSKRSPISDLFFQYFVILGKSRNIAEHNRCLDLKKIINITKETDFGEDKDFVHSILKLLVSLSNTVDNDFSNTMFKRPFSFGLTDEMLPKQPQVPYGSPQPYTYYPSHFFELPYSIHSKPQSVDEKNSLVYTKYTVESFDSTSNLDDGGTSDVKVFVSPMSMASIGLSTCSEFSGSSNFPRLTAPRDLCIPTTIKSSVSDNVESVSNGELEIIEDYKTCSGSGTKSMDIWELVSQVDKNIPDDIWEIAAKMPPVNDRQLIAMSRREVALWRRLYQNTMSNLNVISETQFIRHVMYLIIGIETKSFPFNHEANCFQMKYNLSLEGLSKEHVKGYVSDLLVVGTYYRRLYNFAFNQTLDDHFHEKGLVFESAREIVRRYLLSFRLNATEIYETCGNKDMDSASGLPTLLQILFHLEPHKYEIETFATIYKLVGKESKSSIPYGAELMSYMYNEISAITHKETAMTMFNGLYTMCSVYFKFIERFIFEGELEDRYKEFFIRKDSQYVNSGSKRYWDKGFYISQSIAIPEFLRSLAKCILLCGKSLRLLKQCNPRDPLVALISTDHPSVKCCTSFDELERQQQVLNVYRTRCLFVSGEPATFEQILLKREQDKKAFTEMAWIKQAETLEKIVADRKRLAQLIIAEKQHSLRVLEAAMAEAKAAKGKSKQREKQRTAQENARMKATEEVDSKLKDDEKNKIMEYYSKLNMEVEKSKKHMEWKIKRLQLDQSRMQLLSSEERNYKREKLEKELENNQEVMLMSIKSDTGDVFEEAHDTASSEVTPTNSEFNINKLKAQSSDEVFSTVSSKSCYLEADDAGDVKIAGNNKQYDNQGNLISEDCNKNIPVKVCHTSSSVIGSQTSNINDNEEYLKVRQKAVDNKRKALSHKSETDNQNNPVAVSIINLQSVDEENNLHYGLTTYQEAKKNKNKVLNADFNIMTSEAQRTNIEPTTDAGKEALANKLKVLGVEYNMPLEERKRVQPTSAAHEEAVLNKQKVLGVEYNLPLQETAKKVPANEADEEAIVNRHKVMGVEYNLPAEEIFRRKPSNLAQEEAIVNRQKVMGVEYNLPAEEIFRRKPSNLAQEEAIVNRQKVMGVEYNLPAEEIFRRIPSNMAQEEAIVNRQKVMGVEYNLPAEEIFRRIPSNMAQEEAIVNRQKVMGVEYNLPAEEIYRRIPSNMAQEEAIVNRQKVMGVEYNLPAEEIFRRKPSNLAQEEALSNRNKMKGSDFDNRPPETTVRNGAGKRSGLTLNLRSCSDTFSLGVTPNTGAITPAEFLPRLDLETPTTVDNPLDAQLIDLTPHSDLDKDLLPSQTQSDDNFLSPNSYNYSLIVDEVANEMELTEIQNSEVDGSTLKKVLEKPKSTFNILDGSYNLDEFDPFGMRQFKSFEKDYFSRKIDTEMQGSCYTHPAVIMEEVSKKPYKNIFASHFGSKEDEEPKEITDNIATLSACLQRSVMLPLTYQLEVVNNSILTHFLVNLDLYDHLRSLRDYFFLMDGEFSRNICHNLFSKLVKTVNPQELLNFATLHNILDKALGSSISHVHKFSENLSFVMTDTPLSFQHSSPDVLQCLSLTYLVKWPMNIILSQEALMRYAKVFQFLIKMRRISWVLGEDFKHLKHCAKLSREDSKRILRSPQYISLQLYRHMMASLVRALDSYIVTTCILTSWTEFENDLKKARTLDDLYECHVVYIKKVLFRCLLNNRSTPVMKLLNDIFIVILKFSRVLKAGEWHLNETTNHFTHSNHTQLQELFHLFEKLAKYLHKVVTRLMECGYQRHLVELLTLVNLNGYYNPDRSASDHNSSVNSN